MSWPNKVYSQSMVPKYTTYNDTNMLFRYSGVKRDGKYLDASGNGNNSTSATQTSDGKKRITAATNRSVVASPITGATVLPRTQSHSMGSFVNLVVPTAVYITVFGKGVAGAWSYYPAGGISITNAGLIRLTWYDGGADYTYVDYAMGTLTGKVKHLLYVINHVAGFGYLYINGVLAASNTPTTITAAADYVVEPFKLFASGSTITNSEIGISLKDCTLWSRALVAADVRKEWLQYASMVQFQTGWGAKVSIANESTAGNFVGNGSTPFEILSGTWNLNTSTQFGETTKTIECIAAGTLWLDNSFIRVNSAEGAYGSWQLRLTHNAGTASYVGLACSSKSAFASHNGYAMKLDAANAKTLIRHAAAVETLVVALPAGEVSHIARRFDNVWSGFARADATPTSWVVGATATDATYTSSLGMCFTLNAGDRLSLSTVRGQNSLIKYLGEFSPAEV